MKIKIQDIFSFPVPPRNHEHLFERSYMNINVNDNEMNRTIRSRGNRKHQQSYPILCYILYTIISTIHYITDETIYSIHYIRLNIISSSIRRKPFMKTRALADWSELPPQQFGCNYVIPYDGRCVSLIICRIFSSKFNAKHTRTTCIRRACLGIQ